jgi:hypothetical protein
MVRGGKGIVDPSELGEVVQLTGVNMRCRLRRKERMSESSDGRFDILIKPLLLQTMDKLEFGFPESLDLERYRTQIRGFRGQETASIN